MVLPDRIELSTSPLPMECSTTELRQHARIKNRPKGFLGRGDPCHNDPNRASAGLAFRNTKTPRSARCGLLQLAQLRSDTVAHFLSQRLQRLDRADHDLEFNHFTRIIELDEVDPL